MTTELTALELEIVPPNALEAIERANIDMQITTARKFPRSLATVKHRMLDLATLDEETAESCFYKLSRGGRAIEGPSIRLAEIAASSFGNLRYGSRTVGNDGNVVTSQAFCHDLETNVLCTVESQRSIRTKEGKTYSQDMQVTTANAAGSIALRNAIFKVVPFALIKPIYLAAKQAAVGDLTTLAERRTKMLAKFSALGVDQKRLTESLEKKGIDEIGLVELETLIGVYNAIKDGDQTIDEAFPKQAAADIKFGEALPPLGDVVGGEVVKPKRHRRTKAEIEAAKVVGVQSSVVVQHEDAPPDVIETNGALSDLRRKLLEVEITEAQLHRYLVVNGHIEPSDRFEKLPDSRIADITASVDSLLPEILA